MVFEFFVLIDESFVSHLDFFKIVFWTAWISTI